MSVTVADILHRSGHPVQRITLRIQGDYHFSAGQYLSVVGGDIDVPMSIASAPHRLPELELHYRSTPDAPEAAAMDALLQGNQLQLSAAQGTVDAGPTEQPLLIVAGGSGAAQAFSCAEHRSHAGAAPTTILWCADHSDDVYDVERLSKYVDGRLQVCVDNQRTPQNEGLRWLREHCSEYLHHNVVLCGSPGFVYTVTDLLSAHDFAAARLRSDVYEYAPRT